MIKKCNDFGAGGVSVAIGELAEGLRINLDAVPKSMKVLTVLSLPSRNPGKNGGYGGKENVDAFIKASKKRILRPHLLRK